MRLRPMTSRSTRTSSALADDDKCALATGDSPADIAPTDTDAADPSADATESAKTEQTKEAGERAAHRPRWRTLASRVALPVLILCMSGGAGYLTWQRSQNEQTDMATTESVQAATDATVALLSYKPDTVDKELEDARSRLTGQFLDSYTSLTRDVVIPGAQQKKITATATVPAAAPVSASSDHAVVLLFVNQTVTVGADAPTNSASTVQVSLDRIDDRWLVSAFDPI